MEEFRIRPYRKCDLARLYFPDSPSTGTAVRNFYNLLHATPGLMEQLHEAGYKSGDKILKVKHVRIIVNRLEEP